MGVVVGARANAMGHRLHDLDVFKNGQVKCLLCRGCSSGWPWLWA